MTPEQLRFLKTEDAQTELATLTGLAIKKETHLQQVARLRQRFEPMEVNALVETAMLRQKGKRKFSRAGQMYFTRAGLEQASGEIVSHYRAGLFRQIEPDYIVDLGCGIGGDAIQLSAVALVIGVDLSPVRVDMAVANVAAYGREARFQGIVADAYHFQIGRLNSGVGRRASALFLDPARRDANGKRRFRLSEYEPTLDVIQNWKSSAGIGVKIGPGVDYDELPSLEEAAVEFISVNGGVREGVLWYRRFKELLPSGRRATILPSGLFLDKVPYEIAIEIGKPKKYLYEPDGAIIRAHLVKELALLLNAQQIDREIAYLTSDQLQLTEMAAAYEIIDHFPFQLKRLKRYVAEHRLGELTVKKRGSPLDPEWVLTRIRRKNRAKNDRPATIFLTQLKGAPWVIVTERKRAIRA